MSGERVDIEVTRKRGVDGEIVIRAEGQPVVRIEDELWHQLQHLARALGELQTSSSCVPTARFPRDAFRAAVLAAAERWLAEAERTGGEEDVAALVAEAVAAER